MYKKGNHEEGKIYLQKCLKYRDSLLGAEHTDSIQTATNLATVLYDMHQFDRAMLLYDRLYKVFQKKGKFGGNNAQKIKEMYENCKHLAAAVNKNKRESDLAKSLPATISDGRHEHPMMKVATGEFVCAFCSLSSDGGICYFCHDCQIAVHISCVSTY